MKKLLIILSLLMIIFISNAQDLYSLSASLSGMFVAGTEEVVKEPMCITLKLNPYASYELAVKGEDVTLTINNVIISEFETINITTKSEEQLITISANPIKKKGKVVIALNWISSNE